MGRRQLTRLLLSALAVVVIALVVSTVQGGTTGDPGASPGPDTPVRLSPEEPTPPVTEGAEGAFLEESRLLAAALSDFSVLATELTDHEPLVEDRSGLDEAVAALAGVVRRNAGAASVSRQRLAALAGAVEQRWHAVRPVAVSEGTAEEGVLLVQALGREAGVRAAGLTSALDTLSGSALTAALDAELARPWPEDAMVGADTPA
jgi:hypothetical protein